MQNLKVTRTADFTGSVVTGLNNGLGLLGKGRVFYVDASSGADGYGVQSQNPNYPMETITGAMDLCTSAVGDVIVVMANSPSAPAANETFPIAMDVQGVLLTGLYSRGLVSDSGFGSDVVDGDTITPTANYCTVSNLYLGVKTGSTTADVIAGTTSCYAFTLRNCVIELQYQARYGFYTGASADFPYLLIEDNIFGAHNATRFTNAIRLFNATYGMIRRNVIHQASSYSVVLEATCGNVSILDNKIRMKEDTDGYAIYCTDGSTGSLIDGNHAMFGLAAPGNDPFFEGGNDEDNHFGLNYKGETATGGSTT